MGTKQYDFSMDQFLEELPQFASRGITEFTIHDKTISNDKKLLISVMNEVARQAPELFVTIPVSPSIIDNAFVAAAQKIYCTLDIPLVGIEKGGALLFDKKVYSNKAALLNNAGLVFGFDMEWGMQKGDTYKSFRDRIDFAISLYPNHIDFAQLEGPMVQSVKPTDVYSSKDLDFSRDIAFACDVFYSAGRAVPWFNSVMKALKILPSAFFADFAEWQECSSCSYKSGFNPEEANHIDIEKMQLVFLQQKFEEKNKSALWNAVADLVKLNGAFSRVACEGEESVVETSYNPDDLLGPQSYDINSFCENNCLEDCRVKVFAGQDSPDYKIQ